MQLTVHPSVAALATVAATLMQATTLSVAMAASNLLLVDSRWVDDEVMTDLLSEDLVGDDATLLGSPARRARAGPGGPLAGSGPRAKTSDFTGATACAGRRIFDDHDQTEGNMSTEV